jgi:hypothetical protein
MSDGHVAKMLILDWAIKLLIGQVFQSIVGLRAYAVEVRQQ